MIRNELLAQLLEKADRRTFLKAAGVLGVGAVAGGAIQSIFKVIDVDGDLPTLSRMRPAMGTFVEITAAHESSDLADEAIELAYAEMDRLITILSRHDSSTPLSHLNTTGALSDPPRELTDVVLHALDVNRRTDGLFDPTVKPLIDLLESSVGHGRPGPAEIREAAARVGADGVRFADRRIEFTRDGMSMTLDGVGKGYIVDRMSIVMFEAGVGNHLINAGGDIRTRGGRDAKRPWTVAIEDPAKKGNYPDVVRMNDGAIATSGSYENFYSTDREWHHIVNPQTGLSPQECVSVSVRANSVMEADALSTAAFVMGPKAGIGLVNGSAHTEALLLGSGGGRYQSRGWKGAAG